MRSLPTAHKIHLLTRTSRMEGPILSPAETRFELPPHDTSPTQIPMSPFESHLRKWDSKIDHAVATEPGATSQLTSALQAVKEEDSAPSASSATPSSSSSFSPAIADEIAESFLLRSPPLVPVPSSSPSQSPLSPSTTKVGSASSGSMSLSSGATVFSDPSTPITPKSSGPATGSGGDSSQANFDNTKSQWGTPFRVRWIVVRGLPFHSTRMLRNPWNKDREVKVSRDGTELEPFVGRALLDLWDMRTQEPTASAPHLQQ